MARLFSIFLLGALMVQLGYKLVVLVNYEINKAVITRIYCVNKDKPKIKCQGKCYLNRQISEQGEPAPLKDNNIKVLTEMPGMVTSEGFSVFLQSQSYFPGFIYVLKSSSDFFPSNFHPPALG